MFASKHLPTFLLAGMLLTLAASGAAPAPAILLAPSLDEKIVLVRPTGDEREDRDILLWQNRIRGGEANLSSFERLGWAYVAKARRTLDAGYYKLAEKTADVMDARFGLSDEALLLRGHVDHNLHRFAAAETAARELVARRGLAFDYALLSDALMEQGKLSDSVAACEKMMSLKPGLEAYSRAANLRWLTGDLPGAIQAMEAAVRAGSPLEPANNAWTLSRLSAYYLQAGRTADALGAAEMAARALPDYPPALLARGRALLARGQTGAAVSPLARAEALNPLPEYQWWLADALRAAGQPAAAAKVESELARRGEAADPRTYSLWLATRGEQAPAAVLLARAELTNRADVFTEDALAWSLAASGDYAAAQSAMQAALAAKTQDARLFLHAGEIARACGHAAAAKGYFDSAEPCAGSLTPSERALLERRRQAADTVATSG